MRTLGTGVGILNLNFQIGSKSDISFIFTDENGVDIDISTWTFEFFVKSNRGSRVKDITKTLGSGLSLPIYQSNQLDLSFTDSTIAEGDYVWELRRLDTNKPLLAGQAGFNYDPRQGSVEIESQITSQSLTIEVTLSGNANNVSVTSWGNISGSISAQADLVAALALKANLSLIQFVTPEQFQAAGDGITNDAAAFQLAVDSGKPVYLGQKTYLISSTITVSSNTQIFGSGQGSILKTTSNISIITVAGKKCTFMNFTCLGNKTGSSQIGINITGNAGLTLDYTSNVLMNVRFQSLLFAGFYGFRVLGTTGSLHQGAAYLVGCYSEDCGTGYYLDDRAEYMSFSNCVAFNCTTQGYFVSGGNSNWIGGQIVDCAIGVKLVTGANDGKGVISGCKINHTSSVAVSSIGLAQGFLFDGCYFAVSDVSISTSAGIQFKNCVFSTSNITVTNCTLTEFISNKFRTTPTISITGTNPVWSLNTFDLGTTPTQLNGLGLPILQSTPPSALNGDIQYNNATGKKNITGFTDNALTLLSKGFRRTGDTRMYSNIHVNESLATQALGANLLRAFPMIIERTIVIDLFEINVTTGVGATTARFGIYTDNGNCYPDALITNTDNGTFDTSTSATFPTTTPAANVTLTPGLYWIAFNSNGGPTLRATTKVPNILGSTSGTANSQGMGWTVALTFAALPSTFTAGGTVLAASAVNAPILFFRQI